MGLSLLVSCWMFYRISGALFNPGAFPARLHRFQLIPNSKKSAITLALYVVQVIPAFRAIVLFTAQILGGILASALIYATTPGGVAPVITTLAPEMSLAMGVFLEAITTAGLGESRRFSRKSQSLTIVSSVCCAHAGVREAQRNVLRSYVRFLYFAGCDDRELTHSFLVESD